MARDEFFVKFKYWLVNGGIITLLACGSMTKFITFEGFKPIDSAASLWPLSIAKIPALTISAIKAAV